MKNNNYFRPLLLLAIALSALFIGIKLGRISDARIHKSSDDGKVKLLAALNYISGYYVDPVSTDELIETAIPAILQELDPHSVYIPASELQSSNEQLEGNFDGIGVTFNMPNDTVVVINVEPSGPSDKAGVHPGDRIITVDGLCIAGNKVAQDSVMRLLRGKSGSKVNIDVKREGESNLLPINIVRDKISIKSVDAAYMITPQTGYIRMTKFSKTTHSEFMSAVDKLHSEGMTGMILDLRDNSGGLLEQVFLITSEFFANKTLIVYTEGRASKRNNMYSSGTGRCINDKLIVLIDEGSASASEILAGAIQDNDRGLIIGRRSFGKGFVQQPVMLPDQSCIRLTIARYYTPAGRCIQRPYEQGDNMSYYRDIVRRYDSGELESADSIHQTDSTKFYTVGGRIVYGGGGITPDIFIPLDTVNNYMSMLRRKNLIYNHALAYSDKYRESLLNVKSFKDLDNLLFKHNPVNGFTGYVLSKGVVGEPKEIAEAQKWIINSLKAYIGKTTELGENAVSYYLNLIDNTVKKALENINNNWRDNEIFINDITD